MVICVFTIFTADFTDFTDLSTQTSDIFQAGFGGPLHYVVYVVTLFPCCSGRHIHCLFHLHLRGQEKKEERRARSHSRRPLRAMDLDFARRLHAKEVCQEPRHVPPWVPRHLDTQRLGFLFVPKRFQVTFQPPASTPGSLNTACQSCQTPGGGGDGPSGRHEALHSLGASVMGGHDLGDL